MIIPNLHPIFVHFTVALLSLSAALFVVTQFTKGSIREQWSIVARWCLWFGSGITLITGGTGLYAFNTVTHDTPSHLAMIDHRNWAAVTIAVIVLLGVVSALRVRSGKTLGGIFAVGMVVMELLLAATAWRGGELVYRHGLGVMSLPKAAGHDHAHHGEEGHSHAAPEDAMDFSGMDVDGDGATNPQEHDHEHADHETPHPH